MCGWPAYCTGCCGAGLLTGAVATLILSAAALLGALRLLAWLL